MDDIALFNASVNFVIYYLMSRQFRKTFIEHFGLTCCPECPERNTRNNHQTICQNNQNNDQHEMRPLIR